MVVKETTRLFTVLSRCTCMSIVDQLVLYTSTTPRFQLNIDLSNSAICSTYHFSLVRDRADPVDQPLSIPAMTAG